VPHAWIKISLQFCKENTSYRACCTKGKNRNSSGKTQSLASQPSACNFFLRTASSLWSSLPIIMKCSASHPIFMNRPSSHYHLSKNSTHHLLRINPHLTSIRCMLRFAHSPLNTNKTNNRVCVCDNLGSHPGPICKIWHTDFQEEYYSHH